MQNGKFKNLGSDYKDFKFRRKYDYFLKFRLLDVDNQKIIEEAKELGYRVKESDLVKKKDKKLLIKNHRKRRNKSLIDGLLKYLKK